MRHPRRVFCALVALSAVVTAGCSAPPNRRAINDLLVVAASPAQIPLGALTDTVAVHSDHPWTIPGCPLILVHQTVKHTLCILVHGADLLYYPIALVKGSGPLELYETGTFPFHVPPEKGKELMVRFYLLAGGGALLGGSIAAYEHYISHFGWTSHNTIFFDVIGRCGLVVGGAGIVAAFLPTEKLPLFGK